MMAPSKAAIAMSILALRVFTLLILAGSVVLMATNNYTSDDGSKSSFKDIIAYRFVIATAIVGFGYTAFQIPLAMYHVCTEKRLLVFSPEFDLYGDMIIGFLLATGVGAGFWVTFELKKIFDLLFDSLQAPGVTGLDLSKTDSFLDQGYMATGVLFAGLNCMALLAVLSSISSRAPNTSSSKGYFFFW